VPLLPADAILELLADKSLANDALRDVESLRALLNGPLAVLKLVFALRVCIVRVVTTALLLLFGG
jgi:hypothetical protein